MSHRRDPEEPKKSGYTPLLLAVKHGHDDVAMALVEKGADVNAREGTWAGFSPLHIAVANGEDGMATFLLSKGADPNAKDDLGATPLHRSVTGRDMIEAKEGGFIVLAKLLLEKGSDVNVRDSFGQTALHKACIRGPKELADVFVNNGAKVNTSDEHGNTPLHDVASIGKLEIAKLLISKGADVNTTNKEGQTPLHFSVTDGGTEMVKLLIKSGADVNAAPKPRVNKEELVESIRRLKMGPRCEEKKTITPLDLAIEHKRNEVSEILRKHGAKESAKTVQAEDELLKGKYNVSVNLGRPIIMGSLSKEELDEVVNSCINQIKYCYSEGRKRNRRLKGKVAVKFTISPKGYVTQASVSQTTLRNATVERCITQKIRTWKFPESKGGGIVIANYPFIMRGK